MIDLQSDYSKAIFEQLLKINEQLKNLEPVPVSQWSEQDKAEGRRIKMQGMSLGEVNEQHEQTEYYQRKKAEIERKKALQEAKLKVKLLGVEKPW